MKLKSLIMFSAAALAFAACSNDEDFKGNDGTFDGPGAVSVKIATADLSRALAGDATEGANGGKVDIEGTLTVTLTGTGLNNAPYSETIEIDAASVTDETKLTFWNIAEPTKLTVSVNGGVADYSTAQDASTLTALQVAASKIPAYGETTNFIKTDASSSPVLDNDNDTKENGTEQGAVSGDEDKTYQLYTAKVKMAIPVARLEVSNIMHVTHKGEPDDVCQYATLVANGTYMDNVAIVGGKYVEANSAYSTAGAAQDYSYNGTDGTGNESPLKDMIGTAEAGQSFLSGETLAGPYTYNFFVNGSNPIFKLYFGTAVAAEGADPVSEPRYAMITKYKKEGSEEAVTFEAGKIYRITEAELTDKNILGDEGGNTLWGVEVTVVEAQWDIVNIEADWAE